MSIEHPMILLESNTLCGLGNIVFSDYQEKLINQFLFYYDAAYGNVSEQEKILSSIKDYFSLQTPEFCKAVETIVKYHGL